MKEVFIFALIVLMFEFTIQTSKISFIKKNCTEGSTLECKKGVHNKTYCYCKKDSKITKCPEGTFFNAKYENNTVIHYCQKKRFHFNKFKFKPCPRVIIYCTGDIKRDHRCCRYKKGFLKFLEKNNSLISKK